MNEDVTLPGRDVEVSISWGVEKAVTKMPTTAVTSR
jgi:hypothetical protein